MPTLKPKIIIDSRERQPFDFSFYEDEFDCEVRKLDTGDYTLEGYEGVLCVDRKFGVSEVAKNITEKRFKKELERMLDFKYRFLLCTFSLGDVVNYPIGSTIPKKLMKKLKITSKYIINCLVQFELKYGLHIIFAGNKQNAMEYLVNIFRRVIKNEVSN